MNDKPVKQAAVKVPRQAWLKAYNVFKQFGDADMDWNETKELLANNGIPEEYIESLCLELGRVKPLTS